MQRIPAHCLNSCYAGHGLLLIGHTHRVMVQPDRCFHLSLFWAKFAYRMIHEARSIHEFTFPSIEGGVIDFSNYAGKKILVVNTASDCMYTDQYMQLQELFENYGDKIVVIGFPSNNFGEQEPGTNREIKNFCSYKYGVTFPLASKSDVIGKDANPVFKWLTSREFNNGKNKEITWNFQKYLLDENGKLIEVFSPAADPINETLIEIIGIESPADK